jgi:hypothetical protein
MSQAKRSAAAALGAVAAVTPSDAMTARLDAIAASVDVVTTTAPRNSIRALNVMPRLSVLPAPSYLLPELVVWTFADTQTG